MRAGRDQRQPKRREGKPKGEKEAETPEERPPPPRRVVAGAAPEPNPSGRGVLQPRATRSTPLPLVSPLAPPTLRLSRACVALRQTAKCCTRARDRLVDGPGPRPRAIDCSMEDVTIDHCPLTCSPVHLARWRASCGSAISSARSTRRQPKCTPVRGRGVGRSVGSGWSGRVGRSDRSGRSVGRSVGSIGWSVERIAAVAARLQHESCQKSSVVRAVWRPARAPRQPPDAPPRGAGLV